MTDEMMTLRTLVEKADVVLREMITFAAERLMELEVGALAGTERTGPSLERCPLLRVRSESTPAPKIKRTYESAALIDLDAIVSHANLLHTNEELPRSRVYRKPVNTGMDAAYDFFSVRTLQRRG